MLAHALVLVLATAMTYAPAAEESIIMPKVNLTSVMLPGGAGSTRAAASKPQAKAAPAARKPQQRVATSHALPQQAKPLVESVSPAAASEQLQANLPTAENSANADKREHPGGGAGGSAGGSASGTGPGGHYGAGGDATFGSGRGAGNYFGQIVARLERVKRYPEQERRRGREGTVLVRFVLAREGAVLACHIERGSGLEALDQEVLRMVKKAAPFPPFPETIQRDQLVLVIPVAFNLRQG